jgi:hypothetical protein
MKTLKVETHYVKLMTRARNLLRMHRSGTIVAFDYHTLKKIIISRSVDKVAKALKKLEKGVTPVIAEKSKAKWPLCVPLNAGT